MPDAVSPLQLVAALRWRYATKKFDPTRAIAAEVWGALEESLVLTPSSLGLQPWKFIVVTDPELKDNLVAASHRQTQPQECSHFLVFAVRRNLGAAEVDRHIARTAEVRGVAVETMAKFRAMLMGNLDRARAAGTLDPWQEHQIYIALGQFMASAALLGIDTCPMEGIEAAKYDELLGLTGTGFATVVACAAGYRLADDKYANVPKVRFRSEDVIERR
jgi:nitroreductase